jgi:hypothetical protein
MSAVPFEREFMLFSFSFRVQLAGPCLLDTGSAQYKGNCP